MVLIGVFLIL